MVYYYYAITLRQVLHFNRYRIRIRVLYLRGSQQHYYNYTRTRGTIIAGVGHKEGSGTHWHSVWALLISSIIINMCKMNGHTQNDSKKLSLLLYLQKGGLSPILLFGDVHNVRLSFVTDDTDLVPGAIPDVHTTGGTRIEQVQE